MVSVKVLIVLLSLNVQLIVGFSLYSFLEILKSFFFPTNKSICSSTSNYGNITLPSSIPILNITNSCCNTPPSYCPTSQYRSINGSCNNLKNPGWGTPNCTYGRAFKSIYSDGISKFAKEKNGSNLPNVRLINDVFEVFRSAKKPNKVWNMLFMQFGQLVVHDMSFLISPSVKKDGEPLQCCKDEKIGPDASESVCAPVIIPRNDPIYKPGTCLGFTRSLSSSDIGCASSDKPAEQLTSVTGYMDASFVYGSTDERAASIREYSGGRLNTTTINGQEYPPQVQGNATEVCSGEKNSSGTCFLGGDDRINQNTGLTLLSISLLRLHNHIAKLLGELFPNWTDEKLYQKSRRILIAMYVNIVYNEWLEGVLGKKYVELYKITYPFTDKNKTQCINDYNSTINPAVINVHATAAFRFLHTLIASCWQLSNPNRTSEGCLRLSDTYFKPDVIVKNNNYDKLILGISTQPADGADQYFNKEITWYLFRGDNKFGGDLPSVDMQRGRDHGLPSYVEVLERCNLGKIKNFTDLCTIMSSENVNKLKELYDVVEDVDLTAGARLEYIVPGSQLGPTFLCIVAEQMRRTRIGDSHFFENCCLTPEQLAVIRGVKMSHVLCATSGIKDIQPNAFEFPGPGYFAVGARCQSNIT